jgi:hypothetical protein
MAHNITPTFLKWTRNMCFGENDSRTEGHKHAGQALYLLSHAPETLVCILFLKQG